MRMSSLAESAIVEREPVWTGPRSLVETAITQVVGSVGREERDLLAAEEPLEIQLGYGPVDDRKVKSISVTMRTPGDDFELAAGFLMTEGVVRDPNDIERIWYSTPYGGSGGEVREDAALAYQPLNNMVRVELAPNVEVSLANLQRNFYTTSSCGVCGKASLLALQTACPPRAGNRFLVPADVLYGLPDRLREAQSLFDKTGGIHGAGLFDRAGELHLVREDVGRHNAVDKLLGSEFLADRTPLRDRLLLLSGRASFELMQKALMAGIPAVAAVGAPSSLAVQVARQFDITLVGFLRGNHLNVYHGVERILSLQGERNHDEVEDQGKFVADAHLAVGDGSAGRDGAH